MLNFIDNNHSFDMSLTIGHVSCFSLFSAKWQLYRMFLAYFIRVFVQFNLAGEKYPSTMRDFYFKSMLISLKVILNDEKQSLYLNFSKLILLFSICRILPPWKKMDLSCYLKQPSAKQKTGKWYGLQNTVNLFRKGE